MTSGKRSKGSRLSVRLTPEERLELEGQAGTMRLSDFVRSELLKGARTTTHDPRAVSQVLALLGQSEVFQSLASLEKAAASGALPVDDEIEDTIKAARAELSEIKSLLMRALRTKER